MWIVIKLKTNQLNIIKQEFQKKLNIEPKFFFPKLKYQKIKNNKLVACTRSLLGDYIFCFHPKFGNKKILESINYLKGLKFFLRGFMNYQDQILYFVNKCKKHEDKDGFIKQTFFNLNTIEKIKFLSGPFTNIIFKILKRQKDNMEVTDGKINISFSTERYLFEAA